MKFSHSLQFNCVPEWSEHYLSYGTLKKYLYAIEKSIADDRSAVGKPEGSKPDHTAIRIGKAAEAEAAFTGLFEAEVRRVRDFYRTKEQACMEEANRLRSVAAQGEPDAAEMGVANGLQPASKETIASLAKRLYVTMHDLKDFMELNHTGFARIIQKYERYVPKAAAKGLLKTVDLAIPPNEGASFAPLLDEIEQLYAKRVLANSVQASRAELTGLLRERIVFERSTVWQDMVEMERKVAGVEVLPNEKQVATDPKASAKHHHPKQPIWVRLGKLGLCSLVFFFVLTKVELEAGSGKIHLLDAHHSVLEVPKGPYAQRAGAVCILAIMFWCMEVIPLFATAVLVPFLAVVFRVVPASYLAHHGYLSDELLGKETTVAGIEAGVKPEQIAKAVFASMFSPNVMLLIGGFSIASALSKHGISKRIATFVLGKAGRNPGTVLIVIMALTTVSSMFISNVAAPVLMFTLVQPLLRALGHEDPLAKSIVLGIAYAANIGGLTSPISSPQNILTKLSLEDAGCSAPTIGQWLMATAAVAPFCLMITFWVLRFFYPSNSVIPDVLTVKPASEPFTRKQQLTIAVSCVSIVLLVLLDLNQFIKDRVGTLGVMAIIPLVLFFGLDLLGKEDFNGFMWNVVMIAMGGSAVGTIAKESGLLKSIGDIISGKIEGFSFFLTVCLFSGVMLIVATFVSHSVSSAVMAPLLVELAKSKFPDANNSQASVMVMVTCFVCSVGMGMPISGFPNMTAMSIEDAAGRGFIDGGDFARTGLLASALCAVILCSIGYAVFSYQFPL